MGISKSSGVRAAAASLCVVATVLVVLNANRGEEDLHRPTELQKLDIVRVHVRGAGNSEIHAGPGTKVHTINVNPKSASGKSQASLPDVESSIRALQGELKRLRGHAAVLDEHAAKVGPARGGVQAVSKSLHAYLKYLDGHIHTLKTALVKALPKSVLKNQLSSKQSHQLGDVQRAAKDLEEEVENLNQKMVQNKKKARSIFYLADKSKAQAAKAGVSIHLVRRLFRSVKKLTADVKFGVNGLLNPADGNTLPINHLMKAARVVKRADRLKKRSLNATATRTWIEKLQAGDLRVFAADAASKKAITKALKLAANAARDGKKTSEAEDKAANEAIRAAQGAASAVMATGTKKQASQAAVIAAAAIMAAGELGKALKQETVTAAEIARANSIAASVQIVEARAKEMAEEQLKPVQAEIAELMKGIRALGNRIRMESNKAKKISPAIVKSVTNKQLHRNTDKAKRELRRASRNALLMESKILQAAKKQSQLLVKSNMISGEVEAAALDRAMRAKKQLRKARKNSLSIEVLNSGKSNLVPPALLKALKALNATKALAANPSTGHKALFGSAQSAAALAAEVQLNLAKESMARLGVLDEAAVHVVRENLNGAEKEVAEDDKAAMRTATIAAENVKVATQVKKLAVDSKHASNLVLRNAEKIADSNRKAVNRQAQIEAAAADITAGDMKEDVQKAKHAAQVMAQAVEKARKNLKTEVAAARSTAEMVNGVTTKQKKVIKDETQAANAAKRDGEKNVARQHEDAAASAKKRAAEGKSYSANVNAELQSSRAEETAIRAAEGVAIDSLQTAADSAAILSKANKALEHGVRIAAKAATIRQNAVAKAKAASAKYDKKIKKIAQHLSQGDTYRNAMAWDAAMASASAYLTQKRSSDKIRLHHLKPDVVAWVISSTPGQKTAGTTLVRDMQKADLELTPVTVGAACKEVGMTAARVAASLRRMGASAVDTAKALSMSGAATSAAAIAQAMASDGGFGAAEIASALANAGFVKEQQEIVNLLTSVGLKITLDAVERAVTSNIGAAQGVEPSVPSVLSGQKGQLLSEKATIVIKSMKDDDIKLDPDNIAKALKAAGLAAQEIAQTMIALGIKQDVVVQAMGSQYGAEVARAVAFQQAEGKSSP